MKTFRLLIWNKNYRAPTSEFIIVLDADRARSLASRRLAESANNTAVDVFSDQELLFRLSNIDQFSS